MLLLFPDAHNPADREILFTLETNEELAIWEGAKLTKAQATQETGSPTCSGRRRLNGHCIG